MESAIVAVVCGPHDEGFKAPVRRIDKAIEVAIALGAPLVVAGDAFEGREVAQFVLRARRAGVETVISAFDPRHCTFSDAQAIAREICEHGFHQIKRIHLVTDFWHMGRAQAMVEGEVEHMIGHPLDVIPVPVMSGPQPQGIVFSNERQGHHDYLDGIYGRRRVNDPLQHHPPSVECLEH